jgi:hypothetical protein
VAFVAPGLLVTTAMALAAAESMWPVMGGLKWRRGYHGIAATPLDALATSCSATRIWMALRVRHRGRGGRVRARRLPRHPRWGLAPAVLVAMLVGARSRCRSWRTP